MDKRSISIISSGDEHDRLLGCLHKKPYVFTFFELLHKFRQLYFMTFFVQLYVGMSVPLPSCHSRLQLHTLKPLECRKRTATAGVDLQSPSDHHY